MSAEPVTPGSAGSPALSVIVTLGLRYDDLSQTCRQLRAVLAPLPGTYEVILVDDASGPQTRQKARDAAAQFPEVRLVRLQRRMGEAAALAVGAREARGRVLVTLDAYHHVGLEALPQLIARLETGMDLVCAWRSPRQDRGLSRLATDLFNAAARFLTQVTVHDLNCRVRVMRREVVQEIPLYGDLHRFLPIFAARRGFRWCEMPVPQLPGKQEVGAFNLRAYLGRLMDLLTLAFLTRFVKRPLHFFGLIGSASFAGGLAIALYLSYVKLIAHQPIGHRPLLLLGVLLIVVGIQVASIGLLGELMIFTHARDLKDYVVKETVNG